MALHIVYFHGYGSTPNTDKVNILRQMLNAKVFAFPIDIDRDVAEQQLTYDIDMSLMNDIHADDQVLFVGTSLGGWWASEMAALYKVPAIVINPSCDPSLGLKKYGVSEDLCAKYTPIKLAKINTYFIAEHDEVIDNTVLIEKLLIDGYNVFVDPDGDHRFNGLPFVRVVEFIKRNFAG